VAAALLIVVQLLSGSGQSGPTTPGTRTAAGILVPAVGTPTANADGRALGKADAPVKLIVWSDFQCPNCKRFAEGSEGTLATQYVAPGLLRIEYQDMNVIGGRGGESDAASVAARCADQQGKFWPYHDVLFANQAGENSGNYSRQRLQDMADAVGLDRTKFDACLSDNEIANAVQAETNQGLTRGNGTPTLDFGGTNVIVGNQPYATITAMIDKLLLEKGIAPPSGASSPAGAPSSGGESGASATP
jgi:protein-disulfide isomerase